MKIQNGQWLLKEKHALFGAVEVYEVRLEERQEFGKNFDELCLFMPTTPIHHKGATLGGVVLELRVSTPYENVLRLRTYHHRGSQVKKAHFNLSNTYPSSKLDFDETDDAIVVRSGSVSLEIDRKTADLTFKRDDKVLTRTTGNDLAMVHTDWPGDFYVKPDQGEKFMRQQFDLEVGELIYGMGERFTPLTRNGQSVEVWNADGGTSTEQSYKNIPFYLSNRGYGVFVNSTDAVEFEVGSENVSKVGAYVPGNELDLFFIDGPTMKETLVRYTDLTGKPGLPAPWTFGLWLSTSFTTDYDEATVMHFIDGMIERQIPLSVFHFDCFWMKGFHWMDFTWNEDVFPDPEGLLQRIHNKGIKVCVWINPYVGQASPAFDEGMAQGYFLKRPNGDVWQWDMWQPGMALVDFTNPEACAWFKDKLRVLIRQGVDSFKTDFGERIPTDCVYHNGADPYSMHNYYAYLYNEVVYELLQEELGEDQAVLFARAATTGGQKFPVHWGGDCWSNYRSMAESLRGGLSLTMSGFGFWSHDIGGFEHQSTADVYKRWAAFGLLSTHSRLHGSTSYRVPWVYDDEASLVLRAFVQLKMQLLPYLYSSAWETAETGIPMMRAMVLEHADDPTCHYLDRQYYLGDSLLVAPLFNEEGLVEFYLPEGTWVNYMTKERLDLDVGCWFKSEHDYFSLPIWVKGNTVLPILELDQEPEGEQSETASVQDLNEIYSGYGKRLMLTCYGLEGSGQQAVYENGRFLGNVTWQTEGGNFVVSWDVPHVSKVHINGFTWLEDLILEPAEGEQRVILRRKF